jgi:hypothetical protein
MEQWLLANAGGLSFEVVADRLLCISGKIDPMGLPSLLETAKGFHDAVPAVVADLYPKRPDG